MPVGYKTTRRTTYYEKRNIVNADENVPWYRDYSSTSCWSCKCDYNLDRYPCILSTGTLKCSFQLPQGYADSLRIDMYSFSLAYSNSTCRCLREISVEMRYQNTPQ